jgi:hypothetical protein
MKLKLAPIVEILLIVVTFGFTSCRAQSPVIQVRQSSETTLKHWQTFSSPDASFIIEFPAKPLEQRYSIDSPAGKLEVHSYKYVGSASYFISYTDYSFAIDGADVANAALEHARDGGVRQVNGRLVKESVISIQGHPGRLLVVDSPNGGPQGSMISNKVYLVGRRLYSMQVAIPKDTHESQSLDAAGKKFLDSFKLADAPNN